MKFYTNIYGPQRIKPAGFGEPLIFPLLPQWCWHFWPINEMSWRLLDQLPWNLAQICHRLWAYNIPISLTCISANVIMLTHLTHLLCCCQVAFLRPCSQFILGQHNDQMIYCIWGSWSYLWSWHWLRRRGQEIDSEDALEEEVSEVQDNTDYDHM